MTVLYNSDTLCVSLINNVLIIQSVDDRYNPDDIDHVQNIFTEQLFINNNQEAYKFTCIFDIRVLSTSTIYRYARVFKPFFTLHRDSLYNHVEVSTVITSSFFMRVIIQPVVKLVNRGRSFSFQKNMPTALKFINDKWNNHTIDINDFVTVLDENDIITAAGNDTGDNIVNFDNIEEDIEEDIGNTGEGDTNV